MSSICRAYLLFGDLSEAAKLISTERCVNVCAWAYSFRLSLRPTGGTLMLLSEANMLPLHFFSCPTSLCLALFAAPLRLFFSKHVCFLLYPQLEGRTTAGRHTIKIQIADTRLLNKQGLQTAHPHHQCLTRTDQALYCTVSGLAGGWHISGLGKWISSLAPGGIHWNGRIVAIRIKAFPSLFHQRESSICYWQRACVWTISPTNSGPLLLFLQQIRVSCSAPWMPPYSHYSWRVHFFVNILPLK